MQAGIKVRQQAPDKKGDVVLRRFDNWLVMFIILCSVSGYKLSALGRVQDGLVILGIVVIIISIILNLVYSERKSVGHHFILPIGLIFLSLITSMFMAFFGRDQNIGQTLVAQHAIYYYLFYFLLHRLSIKPRDLEKILIGFGLLYVILFLVQFFLYPTILFDAYIRTDRATVRIYLPGTDYMFIAFFFAVQYFFRTNRLKYLLLLLVIAAIFILTGGRQIMATVVLIVILFLLFDRKIKSRLLLSFIGIVSAVAIYFIFQGIFDAIFLQSRSDIRFADSYVRLRAADYYLTDFFRDPVAYITGNGMYNFDSSYGREIIYDQEVRKYFLSDIGLIGNYAIYGIFFVIGVLIICFRSLRIKIESGYMYIKLMFMTMILSVVIAAGFAEPATICFTMLMLYMLDVSHSETGSAGKQEQTTNP